MPHNWKTTLAGIAAILTAIVSIVNGDLMAGTIGIVAGGGLIAARDHDNSSPAR